MRTALASWLALALAVSLGLESAHWAAMTVWFVAQPDRGALLEKSLFRVLGTLVGAQAGAAIVFLAQGEPWLSVAGLALWVPACAWVGNLLRHYSAYSVLLAGATAAIVVLQSVHQPAHVLDLDFARVANILVGIAVAVAFTLFFSPNAKAFDLNARLQRLRQRTLLALAAMLTDRSAAKVREMRFGIVLDIAALEDVLDHAASGSATAHGRNRHARAVLGCLLSLLSIAGALRKTWEHRQGMEFAGGVPAPWCGHLAESLRDALRGRSSGSVCRALRRLGMDATLRGRLLAEMHALLNTLDEEQAAVRAENVSGSPAFKIVLHRDRLAAYFAGWRSLCAIVAAGSFWVLSGWQYGNLMLMGVCMFVILFSPLENPLSVLRGIVIGSAAGGILAIALRASIFPLLPSVSWIVGASSVVFLVSALLAAHPGARGFAMEIALCFLLVAQPGVLSLGPHQDPVSGALALLAGASASYLTFLAFPPLSLKRRIGEIGAMIVRDLQSMTASRAVNGERWLQRTSHRILRMARLSHGGRSEAPEVVNGCFTILALGRAVLLANQLLSQRPEAPRLAAKVAGALEALQWLPEAPLKAATVLAEAARDTVKTCSPKKDEESDGAVRRTLAEILDEMSTMIQLQSEFFAFINATSTSGKP